MASGMDAVSSSHNPEGEDGEFEVTAEMLLHGEIDDESTLVDEEATQTQEEVEREVSDLQKEGEMPIEQLLAMYGYGAPAISEGGEGGDEGEVHNEECSRDDDGTDETNGLTFNEAEDVCVNVVVDVGQSVLLSPESAETSQTGYSELLESAETSQTGYSEQLESAETSQTGYSELLESAETSQTGYSEPVALTSVEYSKSTTARSQESIQSNSIEVSPLATSEQSKQPPHIISIDEPLHNTTSHHHRHPSISLLHHHNANGSSHSATRLLPLHNAIHDHSLAFDFKKRPLHSAILNNAMLSYDGGSAIGDVRPSSDEHRESYMREGVRVVRVCGDEEVNVTSDTEDEKLDVHSLMHRNQTDNFSSRHDHPTSSSVLAPHHHHLHDHLLHQDPAVEADSRRDVGAKPWLRPQYPHDHLHQDPAVGADSRRDGGEGGGGKPWLRPEYPERRSKRLMTTETARSSLEAYVYFASLLEDGSESDEEYVPQEPSWKKDIKLGAAYQAEIPDCIPSPHQEEVPGCVPSCPCPHQAGDVLVWSLSGTDEEQVLHYLDLVTQHVGMAVGVASNRTSGSDNEQALQVLHRCKQDTTLALKEILRDGLSKGMDPWSEEECRSFENGLRSVGKDFFQLRKQVASRTVKEIVEFYYIWKKTERYDMFVQQYGKIGKRKIVCPPGHFSDFMEKYFDAYDADISDLHYGMTTVYSELKREGTQHSN